MRKQSLLLGMTVMIVLLFTACGSLTTDSNADVIDEISRPTDTVETPQDLPGQPINEPSTTYDSASVEELDCGQFVNDPEVKAVCESQNLSPDQLIADEDTLLDALGSEDVTKCAEILNVHDRDDCYFNLAYTLEDVKVCAPITGFSTRIVCQRELGS